MLKDKVVLVTGAGGGIGREMALLAAKEGAGRGQRPRRRGRRRRRRQRDAGPRRSATRSRRPAARPCPRRRQRGRSGRRGAHDQGRGREFRPIDGVINNAGILRDRIFHRMSHVDWKMVDRRASQRLRSTPAAPPPTTSRSRSRAPSCTSPRPRAWSATSARRTTRRPRWASSACRARSRSTWRRSTCAQLHLAVRLDAHDRHHSGRHRRAEGAPGALKKMTPAKIAPMAVFLLSRRRRRRLLADLRRAHERDHAVQRQPPGALGRTTPRAGR